MYRSPWRGSFNLHRNKSSRCTYLMLLSGLKTALNVHWFKTALKVNNLRRTGLKLHSRSKTKNNNVHIPIKGKFQLALEHAVKVYISPSRGVATNVTHLGLKRKDLKLHWRAKTKRLETALKGKAIVFALMCIGVRSVDDFPPNSSITKNQKNMQAHVPHNEQQVTATSRMSTSDRCWHQQDSDTRELTQNADTSKRSQQPSHLDSSHQV